MSSKADYLKRYLSADNGDAGRKKKKTRIKKLRNLAIHDDDVDFKSLAPRGKGAGSDAELDPEDAPLVCGEIKDETVKKWKKWQPLEREEDDDLSPERRKNDQSPPRLVPRRKRHDSGDFSPSRQLSSPDLSPPRARHPSRTAGDQDTDLSPERGSSQKFDRHNSKLDLSPPRNRGKRRSHDLSPRRGGSRRTTTATTAAAASRGSGRLATPEILQRGREGGAYDSRRDGTTSSDQSPSRKRTKHAHHSDENTPPPELLGSPSTNARKTCHDSADSDLSPPPQRRRQRHDSASPPPNHAPSSAKAPPPKPQRSGTKERHTSPPRRTQKKVLDDDFSPPRKSKSKDTLEKQQLSGEVLMSSGVRAGLQDAELLKKENALARERQAKFFKGLDPDVSGRHAETVYRDKRGRRVDPKEEEAKQAAEQEARREDDEQFRQWGRGVANVQAARDKLADEMYEMSKPLARYADDEDLEKMLKERERDGDPMLAFIRKSRPQPKESGRKEKPKKTRPMYTKKFPANRFAIRPGYRWDGVDRSNGFEKALFARESNKKAVSDEAYKWSVEDM